MFFTILLIFSVNVVRRNLIKRGEKARCDETWKIRERQKKTSTCCTIREGRESIRKEIRRSEIPEGKNANVECLRLSFYVSRPWELSLVIAGETCFCVGIDTAFFTADGFDVSYICICVCVHVLATDKACRILTLGAPPFLRTRCARREGRLYSSIFCCQSGFIEYIPSTGLAQLRFVCVCVCGLSGGG